jgi:hypothetical protein
VDSSSSSSSSKRVDGLVLQVVPVVYAAFERLLSEVLPSEVLPPEVLPKLAASVVGFASVAHAAAWSALRTLGRHEVPGQTSSAFASQSGSEVRDWEWWE